MNYCRICCRLTKEQLSFLKLNPPRVSCWLSKQHLQFCYQASQYSSKSGKESRTKEEEEDLELPYKFSNSRAAQWNVEKSFGAQYSRPWWKVAPLSLALAAFVGWIFMRSETELDKKLEVTLSERLPDLFPPPERESQEEDKVEDVAVSAR